MRPKRSKGVTGIHFTNHFPYLTPQKHHEIFFFFLKRAKFQEAMQTKTINLLDLAKDGSERRNRRTMLIWIFKPVRAGE